MTVSRPVRLPVPDQTMKVRLADAGACRLRSAPTVAWRAWLPKHSARFP